MKTKTLLAPLLFAAACSGGTKHTNGTGGGGGGDGTGGDDTGVTDKAPADPQLAARAAFSNPGGMWMPRQMAEPGSRELLEKLGLELDAGALADPTKAPLSAVVSIGGCTASFVSPEGLIITNHHCVQGALQLNSSEKENLVEDGFLAQTRADERSAGPSQRVWVAQKMTDITDDILGGLDAIADAGKRHDEIEAREKALIAACEKDRPEIKCKTSSFFKGHEWQLIEYLELRDIRLVYVPARSMGNYGGEIDNWEWPRHTADYSFYRAYVGKDGKPAAYSTENVPYQPEAYLKVGKGVASHDLVFIAGYPGKTNRQLTAAELRRSVEWSYPRYLEKARQKMDILAELLKSEGETGIKAVLARQGTQNGLEKYEGISQGIAASDLLAKKQAEDAAYRAWAEQDAANAKYLAAMDGIQRLNEQIWADDEKEEAWRDVVGGSSLLGQAVFMVRWAEEQQKPDKERKLGFQERDRDLVVASQKTYAKRFDKNIDRAMWTLMIQRAAQDPASKAWLPELLGLKKGAKVDDAAIAKALDGFYGKTKVADEKFRMELLKSKPATLKKSKDPFVKLAVKLWPTLKKNEARDEARYGEMVLLTPVYAEGLLAFKGGMVAPDANGTLRLSYGTVKGYTPSQGREEYAPFTTVTEIPKKNTGEKPFDAPKRLLDGIAAAEWGPYASPELGAVPADFLSDLDITGGNSGSPILDARGELVGLAFDGNKEGLASDVFFKGDTTRTIAVDIRYVLWIADAIDQADHIVQEMGLTPSL